MTKKTIAVMLLIALTISLMPASVSSVSMIEPVNDRMNLEYKVSIPSFNDGSAYIIMKITNLNSSELKLMIAESDGVYFDFENLIIIDDQNNKLSYTKTGEQDVRKIEVKDGPKCWERARLYSIDTSKSKSLTVTYRVNKQKLDSSNSYNGYIGSNFAAFSLQKLLFVPVETSKINPDIKLTFDVPKTSNVVTPWPIKDGVYLPNERLYKSELNYGYISVIDSILKTPIAIGSFDILSKNINSVKVNVAVPVYFNAEKKSDLAASCFYQYEYFSNLFGDTRADQFLYILMPKAPHPVTIGGWPMDATAVLQFDDYYDYSHSSHGMVHRWNSWIWGWNQTWEESGRLFDEGINIYYNAKFPIKYVDKLTNMNAFEDLEQHYTTYKKEKGNLQSAIYAKTEDASPDGPWIIYKRGALIFLALDMKIMEDTNNKKSLDDVVKAIDQKHGRFQETLTLDSVIQILQETTGKNYSEFFSDYVTGSKVLNLDKYFVDSDKDYIPNYVELIRGTNPNKYENFDRKLVKWYKGYDVALDSSGMFKALEIDVDHGLFKFIGKNKFEISTNRYKGTDKQTTSFNDKYPIYIKFISSDGKPVIYRPDEGGRTGYGNDVISQSFGFSLDNRLKTGQIYEMIIEPRTKWVVPQKIFVKKTSDKLEVLSSAIEIVADSNNLKTGQQMQLMVYSTDLTGNKQNISKLLKWKTSNPSIATVDANGKIKGLKAGTTTISVSYNNLTANIKITIK